MEATNEKFAWHKMTADQINERFDKAEESELLVDRRLLFRMTNADGSKLLAYDSVEVFDIIINDPDVDYEYAQKLFDPKAIEVFGSEEVRTQQKNLYELILKAFHLRAFSDDPDEGFAVDEAFAVYYAFMRWVAYFKKKLATRPRLPRGSDSPIAPGQSNQAEFDSSSDSTGTLSTPFEPTLSPSPLEQNSTDNEISPGSSVSA